MQSPNPPNRRAGLSSGPGRRVDEWVAFALLVVIGTAAVAGLITLLATLLPFPVVRGWIDRASADGSADPYTPALHLRLQRMALIVGGGLLLSAAFAAWWRKRWAVMMGTIVSSDGLRLFRRVVLDVRSNLAALVVVTVLATVLRAEYLSQPMRYDEAQSFLDYSGQPLFVTVAKYDVPNNHVFYNVLVRLLSLLFGDSPQVIRLPAFLSGIAGAAAGVLLAWSVSRSRAAALLCGLLIACWSVLIEYSVNARGYSLAGLLTIVCWSLAILLTRDSNRIAWLGLVVAGACGLWTVPVLLYPLVMVWGWLLLVFLTDRRAKSLRNAVAVLVAAALTVVIAAGLYLPVMVVSGPRSLIANDFVRPLPMARFVDGLPHAIGEVGRLLGRDVPLPMLFLMAAGLVFFPIVITSVSRRRRWLALLSVLGLPIVIGLQRVHPPARVLTVLLPLVAVCSTAGWVVLLAKTGRVFRGIGWIGLGLVFSIGPIFLQHQAGSIANSPETGFVPESEALATWLQENVRDREPVIVVSPVSAPLVYYALRRGFDMRHFDWPGPNHTLGDIALVACADDFPQTVDTVLKSLGLDHRYDARRFEHIAQFANISVWRFKN